jgi:hypothetical protein
MMGCHFLALFFALVFLTVFVLYLGTTGDDLRSVVVVVVVKIDCALN